MEFEELFMLVRELFNRSDLMGLRPGAEAGSPIDEYEHEATVIATFLFTRSSSGVFEEDVAALHAKISDLMRVVSGIESLTTDILARDILNQTETLMLNRPKRQRQSFVCTSCERMIDPKNPGSELLVWRSIHDPEHRSEELWMHSHCLEGKLRK